MFKRNRNSQTGRVIQPIPVQGSKIGIKQRLGNKLGNVKGKFGNIKGKLGNVKGKLGNVKGKIVESKIYNKIKSKSRKIFTILLITYMVLFMKFLNDEDQENVDKVIYAFVATVILFRLETIKYVFGNIKYLLQCIFPFLKKFRKPGLPGRKFQIFFALLCVIGFFIWIMSYANKATGISRWIMDKLTWKYDINQSERQSRWKDLRDFFLYPFQIIWSLLIYGTIVNPGSDKIMGHDIRTSENSEPRSELPFWKKVVLGRTISEDKITVIRPNRQGEVEKIYLERERETAVGAAAAPTPSSSQTNMQLRDLDILGMNDDAY